MKVFQELLFYETFKKSHNATFIVLISKKSRGSEASDYRPISLMNRVYKIIFKVLAKRGEVVQKIISKPQNASVRG